MATAPPDGRYAAQKAMAVRVNNTTVEVMDRDVRVAFADRNQMTGCAAITFFSNDQHTVAKFVGLSAGGSSGELIGDQRPQVVGVFSNLTGAAPAGLRFHMNVDSRFSSTPSLLKQLDIVGAVLCTLIALFGLARLDALDGRRHRRFLPGHWLKLTLVDAVVFVVLIFWHFCGANTSDDGYILIMARTAPHAGYHGQLLPLVRRSRSPVRLVLQHHRVDGQDLHGQPLGAVARAAGRAAVLDGDQPGGGPAARALGAHQPGGAVDRPPWSSWRSGCPTTTVCGRSPSWRWARC